MLTTVLKMKIDKAETGKLIFFTTLSDDSACSCTQKPSRISRLDIHFFSTRLTRHHFFLPCYIPAASSLCCPRDAHGTFWRMAASTFVLARVQIETKHSGALRVLGYSITEQYNSKNFSQNETSAYRTKVFECIESLEIRRNPRRNIFLGPVY